MQQPSVGPLHPHLSSEAEVSLAEACAWQQQRCAASGAPVAAALLSVCSDTAAYWAPAVGLDGERVRFGDHLPLRVMAALHFLALTRRSSELAMWFPTLGGDADPAHARFTDAIAQALAAHTDVLQSMMAQVPQTNEPGRQIPLKHVLSGLPVGEPIDLVELACSAGLNLRVDASDIPGITVASRRGCDVNPIDINTTDGRALLSSYIWVDDTYRFKRLGAAIAAASEHQCLIEQNDVTSFVKVLQPREAHTTLLWQSALAPYLDAKQSASLTDALQALVQRAPSNATIVYATWEDAGDTSDPATAFALVVHTWSRGKHHEDTLARGSAHGVLAATPPSRSDDGTTPTTQLHTGGDQSRVNQPRRNRRKTTSTGANAQSTSSRTPDDSC